MKLLQLHDAESGEEIAVNAGSIATVKSSEGKTEIQLTGGGDAVQVKESLSDVIAAASRV